MVFPVVMYSCESWTIKRLSAEELMFLNCSARERRLLRVIWTARRSNQSILKEINHEYSLEGMMLKLKLWPSGAKSWFIGKDPDAGKDWRQKKRVAEDKIVGWNHLFNEHELGQTPRDSEGQGSLKCCSPWGCKELDMTEQLSNNNFENANWFCDFPYSYKNAVYFLPGVLLRSTGTYLCAVDRIQLHCPERCQPITPSPAPWVDQAVLLS